MSTHEEDRAAGDASRVEPAAGEAHPAPPDSNAPVARDAPENAPGSFADAPVTLARALGLGTELAFNIVVPLVLGIWLGAWLDKRLQTSGLCLISMMLLGLLVGAINFFRVLSRFVQWK